MKAVVPYKLSATKTISPHQVNENARVLWEYFRQLERKRYNYFTVIGNIHNLDNADAANEGSFVLKAPFPLEIVGAELVCYGDEGGAAEEDTITATCSLSGFNDLSVDVTHTNGDLTTEYHDLDAQSLRLAADQVATFTVSRPSSGLTLYGTYMVFHCRYDFMSEATHTLPDPPSVMDGETFSITEWNTWFSSMSTAITALSTAYKSRKRIEAHSFGRDAVFAGGEGPVAAKTFVTLPAINATVDEGATHYYDAADDSGGAVWRSEDQAADLFGLFPASNGAAFESSYDTTTTNGTFNDPDADYTEIRQTAAVGGQTIKRFYMTIALSN